MSVRSFETTCGFSHGFVANMAKSMQPDKVERISHCFPELNVGWLMTGEGAMMRSSRQEPQGCCQTGVNVSERADDVTSFLAVLMKKDEEIARLNAIIRNTAEEVGALRERLRLLSDK